MLMKKIAWLFKLIYRLNVILIKIPVSYFVDIDNLLLKFIWRGKKKKKHKKLSELPQDSQHNLEGEEQSWRTDTTQFQDLLCNQDSMILDKV